MVLNTGGSTRSLNDERCMTGVNNFLLCFVRFLQLRKNNKGHWTILSNSNPSVKKEADSHPVQLLLPLFISKTSCELTSNFSIFI